MENKMATLIPGYKYVGIQEGICGSRPTLIGHRIEPRDLKGLSIQQIHEIWDYLSMEQITEGLRFAETQESTKK
jgi:uncharacterized protein (DUF433 family)